jgi:hypothetical protein
VISLDPRSIHSRQHHIHGIYGVMLDRLDVVFRMMEHEHEHEHQHDHEHEHEQTKLTSNSNSNSNAAVEHSNDEFVTECSCSSTPATAQIFFLSYYPDDVERPKMRTQQWFQTMKQQWREQTKQ